MRQFQVPQFIDVEDKIIGPLTLKQFLYLAGGGAIVTIAKAIFLPALFYPIALVFALLSLALAFYKVDGVPFAKILVSGFYYFSKPHLYIWKQEELTTKEKGAAQMPQKETIHIKVPSISESKLKDLAWSLDIKEKLEERH